MDLAQSAAYFNTASFDTYDFVTAQWRSETFEAALKYAPESFTVNDLSTKKRMLFVAAGVNLTASVIRPTSTGVVYMVENREINLFQSDEYRSVYNLHTASGSAVVSRKAPIGPADNPGWAVETVVENTYADFIFQRVPTSQETDVNQYGLYTLYLPSDSTLRDHDTVALGNNTFFVFDAYKEQGLVAARVSSKPDARRDIVYTTVTQGIYDPTTLSTTPVTVNYNVTAQFVPADLQASGLDGVVKDNIKLLIDRTWIGVVPKLNDKVSIGGKVYIVEQISQNMILDQWQIVASV